MKKFVPFLLCLYLIALSGSLFAVEEAVVRLNYTCRDSAGLRRWKAETEIINIRPGVYLMVEKAAGIYSGHSGRISWVARMEFERTKNSVRPLGLDKRVFDASGKMVRRETQKFDLADNTGICTHEEPGRNISRTRKFKFDKDVVTRLSLGPYIQKLLESGKTRERVHMVSEEPNAYDVELKVLGKEVIRIGSRKRTVYRLCIDPKLGILDLVKAFLPKAYAWHAAGPGYEWLGYEGLEGGINSEKIKVMID
jgi:hypothetical protein